MAELTGALQAGGLRIAIVAGRFNSFITERLLEGAIDAFVRSGGDRENLDIVRVPGSWEMPVVVAELARQKRHDAIVCLGAVIRGETPHFDFVAGEASRGIAAASAEFDVPVGFGLLTTDTMEQASARAGGDHGNKGWDAALAALEMADLFDRLDVTTDEG